MYTVLRKYILLLVFINNHITNMQGCLAHDMHNWKEINADKRRKAVLDRLDDTTKDSQECENVEELLVVFLRSVS